MNREVRWSKLARKSYIDLLLDIQDNWGDDVAVTFAQKVEKTIQTIQSMPFIYPAAEKAQAQNTRRCVLSKQTSLYYKVEDTFIDLIVFYDNRKSKDSLEL